MQTMSLTSKPQASQPSAFRHASSSTAQKHDAHNEDELRATLQEVLTDFVTDTMCDRPEDILQYMVEWVRKQQAEKKKESTSLSPLPPPRVSNSTRPAPRGASIESVHHLASPETTEHVEVIDNAADQIMSLAQHRQQHLCNKAEGCKDHYLMALEDSDGDIFHINALRKTMDASRKAVLDAQADTAAVAAELRKIEENEDSEEAKAQKRTELLHAYEHQWEKELPKGHLN
ncbi:hypothetical protein ABB37_09465 [Leptomonas pyrrhocoris]|uniref:Uncharacterized protein n=1 Tax=Leptomonas pyrrhocoris TaxID=157538 RepID=A0A0N0DRA9_LEPPY|nr:hypothetical protein ABB37_09465 [Leptomonas pyrrhocoris]XP_015652652.1 hypothetical protein ABB37_09465 [Leptomonas pyrrhocoris]XP_015652653.1 hypothetical protein ABB37_09465 [Leptomonas pyrrhocoris]KPA74212.1 hypothetical protein ABB37_09465 [Leptomonas pyrrhocoris]KPA74213.1 hypothetical protein ABB37_09465 [Leptomonas pyrrhocoris]KPA74214.1 hypothetical protein ABB37_09465 [Leptomonas pyrrhocoris]|eukprot:XP_015652651.1 hypothetical protein ABB37_09465 [Leptomonas pyrrhocoris]